MDTARALERIAGVTGPVTGVETVGLRAACGRIRADDIVAGRDVPGRDNSAVDGVGVIDLDDALAIADYIIGHLGLKAG